MRKHIFWLLGLVALCAAIPALLQQGPEPGSSPPLSATPASTSASTTLEATPQPVVEVALDSDISKMVALHLFWDGDAEDNLSCTALNNTDVARYGEEFRSVRYEGRILAQPAEGTIPLRLFKGEHTDYLTAADEGIIARAKQDGYQELEVLGYVYAQRQPGLKPLLLFYNPERSDYFLSGTKAGIHSAGPDGYEEVGVQGWVFHHKEKDAHDEVPPLNHSERARKWSERF